MTHDTAIRALATYSENSLNGAELSIRLGVYESLVVVLPTAAERNELRAVVRVLCGMSSSEPCPEWAKQDELNDKVSGAGASPVNPKPKA